MGRDLVREAVKKISDSRKADLYLINSQIDTALYKEVFGVVTKREYKDNKIAFLILSTPGGDPSAAFKIARLFQRTYQSFVLLVPDICKSAGTLLGIGADEIILGPAGELGPLDIQVGKEGEILGWRSGLDIQHGIDRISHYTFTMFERFMLSVTAGGGGNVGFQAASKIACDLVRPFLEKTSEQISPLSLGETMRAMAIGEEYGKRLDTKFRNLKNQDAFNQLLAGYPYHGFVIDLEEAKNLFKRVTMVDAELGKLLSLLDEVCHFPIRNADGRPDRLACLLNKVSEKGDTVERSTKGKPNDEIKHSQAKGGGRAEAEEPDIFKEAGGKRAEEIKGNGGK